MREYTRFYIDGQWVEPAGQETLDVLNPATEAVAGRIALGTAADVDKAVHAARRAFPGWSATSREDRLAILGSILAEYQKRADDLAAAVTEEMGAPVSLARNAQVQIGLAHLATALEILKTFPFTQERGQTLIAREPIGVCGLITPWNWPLNQITCKVAPAIATGCTMVLKPSEIAPFSAQIFTEILEAAGLPAGVFNLVHGDGIGVGVPLSSHPEVDMVSFTGSTRAGIEVARNAAATVKRVAQELGGKSPHIVLDDAYLPQSVAGGVQGMMINSGQSCNAPSRMLVPAARMAEAIESARAAASSITVGPPDGNAQIGPVASQAQFDKIRGLIQSGIDEGATLVAGGVARPEGLDKGYYVQPTVFANVTPDMTIAREEIFGPVLSIMAYQTLDEAIEIGNDTEYGLAAYVSGADIDTARKVAARMRAGQVSINGARDLMAPFGGYKRSGNGREWGDFGFHEFVEVKAVLGYASQE
ncbi:MULTISPECIES: aldehyde dehydrogenase family protein [unclassified Novosphingobium]|uniref:aldehyde dehydrogenase family protein n=1 Tax=unclassified Novosphingobium TaxID=2644732 RepID=UPI0014948FF0|nr:MULTISPECIES: aldehyde dehydrogenase family protein [unclassified Novosphingobium]MBB3358265.1 aldehyde dehydrogenase (NAD+) [Novosphingobium sp. BK256]MBB3374626.1 aldehyde dehydrogenase (NAD+) [Novosphingobium sp. BK280]MBB3379038.1 aldehyde dehydrogenase (NAD+) [Novosphingobium sp. BK258]MBB3420732.1 aldehyde dehydrogenase (NAD+) [Novosphingobium sp. BK267]MBB3448146.1 aldehyde dehydrogenase (NAD+) [Novosphingobium sp. BK352]